MGPTLTPDSTLETLKKQAKRWLKAIRAGDKQAQQRLLAATGLAPAAPGLRHVQLALAREYGFPGWSGKLECWTEVAASTQIGGSIPLNALDYLLSNAVGFNHPKRVQWLLRHGANANCMQAYSQRPLREAALVRGHTSVTELLVLHGAAALPLEGESAFRTACMQLDRETARALAARNPEYLQDAWLMLTAAEANRSAVVALLLELGMNVDSADGGQLRGLQAAVRGDARDVVNLLIRHGAEVDRPTTGAGGGALGFAAHFKRRELADLLAPLSRDVGNLVYLRMKQRLSELFGEDPSLVNPADPKSGSRPLLWLPDDEDEAVEMTTFLLAYGADAGLTNNDGITAEEAARKRGLADAADLMRASRKEHRH